LPSGDGWIRELRRSVMRPGRLGRLSTSLVLSHVVLVLLPAALISVGVLHYAEGALERTVGAGQEETARRAASEVLLSIREWTSQMKSVAVAMNVVRDPWQRQSLLSEARLEMPGVRDLVLVGLDSLIQASSELDERADLMAGRRLPPGYWPYTPVRPGGLELGKYLIRDSTGEGAPQLRIAMPVVEGEEVTGILLARLGLYTVWRLVDAMRIGETGRGCLLTHEGKYLSHPDRRRAFLDWSHPAFEDIQGSSGVVRWTEQREQWMAGYAQVGELGWYVVLEQRVSEALAARTTLRWRMGVIVACSIALAIAIGWVVVRSVVSPVQALVLATRRLQRGAHDEVKLCAGHEELRELGQSFTEMACALGDREGELRTALAFQQDLLAEAPLGVAVIDADGAVVQANPVWLDVVGVGSGEAVDRAASPGAATISRWLATGEAESDLEVEDVGRGIRSWHVKRVDLRGQMGRMLLVEDQTDRKVLEMHGQQAAKLAALGEMAAGVAHEIKNPLAIIQGGCDLMQRLKPEETGEREDTLDTVERAVTRISQRIAELLNFARPAAVPAEALDINEVLGQVLSLGGQRFRAERITVGLELGATRRVRLNHDVAKDIFLELLANARRAMLGGGTLKVVTRDVADEVIIDVVDTGAGIAADTMNRIFDPFYTTWAGHGGTGLGLSVLRRQAAAAGGHIEVRSAMGQGTTFSVRLPAIS